MMLRQFFSAMSAPARQSRALEAQASDLLTNLRRNGALCAHSRADLLSRAVDIQAQAFAAREGVQAPEERHVRGAMISAAQALLRYDVCEMSSVFLGPEKFAQLSDDFLDGKIGFDVFLTAYAEPGGRKAVLMSEAASRGFAVPPDLPDVRQAL